MVHPDLKDAVWQVIEDFCTRAPEQSVHSDLVMRKFPQVNEQELLNAIGELLVDGTVTGKASSVDPYGNPTAFHLRLRDTRDRPDGGPSKPPRGGVGEFSVGFGDTPVSTSRRETEEPKPPDNVKMKIKDDQIGVGFGVDEGPSQKTEDEEKPDRLNVKMGGAPPSDQVADDDLEANFEEELNSFFTELQMAQTSDEDAKSQLTDQLMLLMAMFKSSDAASFTTPINKLAALKGRVKRVAPDLVGDYILLVQTAVRAWLARM
ncbi:MAG: hypothetical protein GF341_08480 [candidate division Zixibacteria bacterium]|nr:hypothetical protein [candidate division Zixibacteria bacterium]